MPEAATRRKTTWHLLAFALFAATTMVMTWPLARGFGSRTLGAPGDNMEYIWKTWWFKHSLVDLGISPFFDPDIYYPVGFSLALGEMTPANTVLALPVTMLFDGIVAYNAALFASFVLSAFGTYLLVLLWTGNYPAALLSGMIFAFCPYRTTHSAGHLPTITTQWLPFLFLFVERVLRERKLRYGILAGLAYALTALSTWYYALYAAVLVPVYILLRLRPWRRYLADPFLHKAAACFVAVALAGVLPFLTPYLEHSTAQPYRHPLHEHLELSASVPNFFGPSLLHPVWGGWLRARWNPSPVYVVERSVSLGVMALGLAGLGLAKGRRHRPVQAATGLGVTGLVLAFGPVLHLGDSMAKIPLPPGAIDLLARSGVLPFLADRLDANLVADMIAGSYTFVPLPGLLLYLFFPGFTSTRVWARFGVFPALAVALLAGWGLLFLFRWLARTLSDRSSPLPGQLSQPLLGGLLSLLVLFESLSIVPSMSFVIRPRAVDLWLREQEGDFAIMEYPIVPVRGSHLYYSIIHQKKLILGYTTYVPREFQEWIPILGSFPSPQSLRSLYAWNVRYILLDAKKYGDASGEIIRTCETLQSLHLVGEMEGIHVYELVAPTAPHAVRARLGEVGEILGFGLDRAEVSAGGKLRLTLFWRSLGSTPVPYKVFAHLVSDSGQIVAQHDAEPCRWKCPTTGWVPNGLLFDVHPMTIGPEVQPGEYTLLIGIYDESFGERVPAYDDQGGLLPEGRIVLGSVKVGGWAAP